MKRKMILWAVLGLFGIWALAASQALAESAKDDSKDKPASTETKKDEGGLKVDWGDDDKKTKETPQTQPSDKGSETQPADKGSETKPAEDDGDKKSKKTDESTETKEEPEVVVLDALEDFYAKLARSSAMPEDQQKKLVILQDRMKKSVEKQQKTNEAKIEHLEKKIAKSEDEKRNKKYQAEIDKLNEGLKKIEERYHVAALKILKGDQITKWNESLVWSQIEPDMNMMSVSEDQRKKAKAVCGEVVSKYKNRPLPEAAGPKLRMVAAKKILKEVLTEEQAKEYKRYLSEQLKDK